ncbi:MAG: hypothetical protein GC149_16370 [Gammaproteobacteria bacterium]|nr:hypothetical protein [Gammaproteobacteria bacterium]
MNRTEIENTIISAFGKVLLGNGVGLYEAEAIDNYESQEFISEARKKDRVTWKNWGEIPVNAISTFHSALCFVDAEGMRYLLPAYMLFAVMNYDKTDSAAIDSAIYALDRGMKAFGDDEAILSHEQKKAIIDFLRFMVFEAGEDMVDADVAMRAYVNHWVKYDK